MESRSHVQNDYTYYSFTAARLLVENNLLRGYDHNVVAI